MEDISKNHPVDAKGKNFDSVQSKNGNYLIEDNFYGINKKLYKKSEKPDDIQIKTYFVINRVPPI